MGYSGGYLWVGGVVLWWRVEGIRLGGIFLWLGGGGSLGWGCGFVVGGWWGICLGGVVL